MKSIFRTAREMAARYDELGFDKSNSGVADEALLSIALAQHGIPALPTMPDASASLLGTSEPPDIVVAGRATFLKNGRVMEPAIVHFAGDHSSQWLRAGATYRRERRKLRRAAGSLRFTT